MKRSIATICTAAACLSCSNSNNAEAFTTPSRRIQQTPSRIQTTKLNLHIPLETLHSTSNYISTISADIDNIPDDEFGKVFAGGGIVMLGSVISTMIVGALVESGEGGYADLVAETYAEQDLSDEGKETFLNSLGLTAQEKAETEEMVRAFREKKMRKAGTWTEADEEEKNKQAEEKDMFSDYD